MINHKRHNVNPKSTIRDIKTNLLLILNILLDLFLLFCYYIYMKIITQKSSVTEFQLRPSSISLFDTMGTDYLLSLKPHDTDQNKNLWTLHITIKDTGEKGILVTSRGETRIFKDVNTAVDLVKKYSSKFKNLELTFSNVKAKAETYEQV